MLHSLRIQNLALVDTLEWYPEPGFLAVTGETGAGKSILLGALNLILGERADRSLIRTGEEQTSVEAVFEIQQSSLDQWLEENGLDPCEEGQLLLRRMIQKNGSGRQFINGSPATLALLKQLGDRLVDLHGPHDHQSLFSPRQQLLVLDAYSAAEPQRQRYAGAWKKWRAALRDLEQLAASEGAVEREIDLLEHQVREIESAGLRDGEEEELEQRHRSAANSQRLIELANAVVGFLAMEEGAVGEQLAAAGKSMAELERLDPALSELARRVESAAVEIRDLSEALQEYAEKLDLDPAALQEMEDRLNLLQGLRRKYGPTFGEVVEFGRQAAEKLDRLQNRGRELERMKKDVEEARTELHQQGLALSKARESAAPKLAREVSKGLADLGFPQAAFQARLTPLEEPGTDGLEEVEFVFAPNPGEESRALRQIASSGEISRVMLAIKSVLAEKDHVPVLVFDEIDANVGGEIAHAVGRTMRRLGKSHQVFCITHLPQVAAASSTHYMVSKETREGRTFSRLNKLEEVERKSELARMLGGKSDSALRHASALLDARES